MACPAVPCAPTTRTPARLPVTPHPPGAPTPSRVQVLTQKVVRKQDCIATVDRSHAAYTAYEPPPAPTPAAGDAAGGASASGPAAVASASNGGGAAGAKPKAGALVLERLWRAPGSLRPMFGPEAAADKERLYSEGEIATALRSYAAAEGEQRLSGARASFCLRRPEVLRHLALCIRTRSHRGPPRPPPPQAWQPRAAQSS